MNGYARLGEAGLHLSLNLVADFVSLLQTNALCPLPDEGLCDADSQPSLSRLMKASHLLTVSHQASFDNGLL